MSDVGGRTRISEAVLDTIVMTTARSVGGVVDITGVRRGVLMGGVVGGALGFAGGGVSGAAVGAPVGGAVGAAAAHWMQRREGTYHDTSAPVDVQVRLSARYGADLVHTARLVRERVRAAARAMAGIELGQVEVIFTRVVAPADSPAR